MGFIIFSIPFYVRDLNTGKKKLSNLQRYKIKTATGVTEYATSGSGFPVLISHGIQGGFDQGLSLAQMYLGEGYRIIAPSRFGYLNTDLTEDPTPMKQAESYIALLDSLSIERVVIMGNSAGGSAAFKFAIYFPERCAGLILVSSSVPDTRPLPPRPVISVVFHTDYLYWLLVRLAKKSMLSMFISPAMFANLSREDIDRYYKDVLLGSLPVSLRADGALNDMYLSNRDINKGYEYAKISSPVLMFHAKDDPLPAFEEAEFIAEQISDIRFYPFEEGGHLLIGHLSFIKEKTEEFLLEIRDEMISKGN